MPVTVTHLQKQFKLSIVDNLPRATVAIDATNGSHKVMCCPLCGCVHQIVTTDETVPYTPLCQALPDLFKANLMSWRKLYPDAAKYKMIHLEPVG